MKWVPHQYQKEAIKFCLGQACAGLLLAPGLGKTSIILSAFKLLRAKGYVRRMLVISPLRPMERVWPAEAEKWDEFQGLKISLLHGPDKDMTLRRASSDIDVINPEGLAWLTTQVHPRGDLPWDVLCVDECFPAETQVRTPIGDQSIAALRPGDMVETTAGPRPVVGVGSRLVSELVELELTDGRRLRCTPEHPIFTDLGWLPARLVGGCRVFTQMPDLPPSLPGQGSVDPARARREVLLSILRAEADVERHGASQEDPGIQEHEPSQYWALSLEQREALARGTPGADFPGRQEAWADLYPEGRQRDGDDSRRSARQNDLAREIYLELRGKVGWQARWLSYLLQSGLWGSTTQGSPGGGRGLTPADQSQGVGSEEGGEAGQLGVARVSRVQLDSPAAVYNLRVAGCPHFYAASLIVHNSTRFKHSNTQRFKHLSPYLDRFKRRYILTGSPAPNGLLDLFGQVYILDLGNALGRYVSHYRLAFFNQTGYGGYTWVPKSYAEERIYKRLAPLVLRLAAEDYLQLPPLLFNRVEVDLPPVARKAYREMETLLITQVKEEKVLAANAAAATMKCRQIANGGIYGQGPEGRVAHELHEAKVDAAEEIIEELQGKPALVAYEFEHDRDRLLRRLGPDTPWIGGGVSARRFRDIETAWNRGEIPILLAQPQSVAHGLNLQGTGAHIIEAGLTWNLEDREQFIARVWRQGQKEPVVVHSIVARDTVDEIIMKALAKKDKGQKALLSALKEYADDR